MPTRNHWPMHSIQFSSVFLLKAPNRNTLKPLYRVRVRSRPYLREQPTKMQQQGRICLHPVALVLPWAVNAVITPATYDWDDCMYYISFSFFLSFVIFGAFMPSSDRTVYRDRKVRSSMGGWHAVKIESATSQHGMSHSSLSIISNLMQIHITVSFMYIYVQYTT